MYSQYEPNFTINQKLRPFTLNLMETVANFRRSVCDDDTSFLTRLFLDLPKPCVMTVTMVTSMIGLYAICLDFQTVPACVLVQNCVLCVIFWCSLQPRLSMKKTYIAKFETCV